MLFFQLAYSLLQFCHPGLGSPVPNALLLEVCLGLLQLTKVPTIGLRGSILQHGTDLNWLLSEMPFCNTDEWPRE